MASNVWAARAESEHSPQASGSTYGQYLESGVAQEDPSKRPQAAPLPRKRGEIGYKDTVDGQPKAILTPTSTTEGTTLLSMHPTERHASDSPVTPSFPNTATPLFNPTTASQDITPSGASSAFSAGKYTFIAFLKSEQFSKIGGIGLSTLLRLVLHLFFIAGTIVAWVLVVQHTPSPSDNQVGLNTTQIFIHVTFVVVTLMQLIFLERVVFRVRAERYAHKHTGQVLPTSRTRSDGHSASSPSVAFAPWNRPPLPTYAAALAANGHGTGDVEDNVIAIPPPPAYGNTRGSTLLLAGLMPETLRAQRTRERVRSGQTVRGSLASRLTSMTARSSRPVSYRSHDSAWEERMDADRALVLEETLAKLEEGK